MSVPEPLTNKTASNSLGSSKSTFSGIFQYLWTKNSLKLRLLFIFSVIFLILSRLSNAAIPFFFKLIIERIGDLTHKLLAVPASLILLYLSFRMLAQIFNELRDVTFVHIEQNAVQKVASDVFKHIHNLSLSFHLNRKTGELTRAMERGAKAVETLLRFSTFNIIPTFFEILLVCAALLVLYPISYAATIFITLVFYIFYTITTAEWRTQHAKAMKQADNNAGYRAVDSLLNYETVKYFNNTQLEISNYSILLENYRRLAVKNRISLSILNIGQAFIIAVGLGIINIITIKAIIGGTATIGDFALVNSYLLQLYQPLSNLGFSYREIKLAYIDIENLFALLKERKEIIREEIKEENINQTIPQLIISEGAVEFKDISFHYIDNREIIKNISFKIAPGKTCAIVGKSGSGKSTIVRLLFRFYSPSSGTIEIDGQNIAKLDPLTIQRVIGIVPQDTILFNDSLFYNIAYGSPYGRPKPSLEEVINVAKLANIHNFINSLPERYETQVGERGLKLSGGEKQRVAIARLLLKNPKIFIFDEATSALDTKTEKAIQESIRNISKGHTTLIIAHRLSTIIEADEIIVLDQGQIAERGTHQQLINLKKLYYNMWQQQKNKEGAPSV